MSGMRSRKHVIRINFLSVFGLSLILGSYIYCPESIKIGKCGVLGVGSQGGVH